MLALPLAVSLALTLAAIAMPHKDPHVALQLHLKQQAVQDTVPFRPPTSARGSAKLGETFTFYPRLKETVESPFVTDTLQALLGRDTVDAALSVRLFAGPGEFAVTEPPKSATERGFIQLSPLLETTRLEDIPRDVVGPLITMAQGEPKDPFPSRAGIVSHEFGHAFQFTAERKGQKSSERSVLEKVLEAQAPMFADSVFSRTFRGRGGKEEAFADAFAQAAGLLRLENTGVKGDKLKEQVGKADKRLPGTSLLLDFMRERLRKPKERASR